MPEEHDIAGQLRLYADQMANGEVMTPDSMLALGFREGTSGSVHFFNLHTDCKRERIPIYTMAICLLLEAIDQANAEAST